MRLISAPTGEKIALIEGQLPAASEWDEIISANYLVNILWMPDESSTLDGLMPVAHRLRRLGINSYSCSDLRALDQFSVLEELYVGGRVTHAPTFDHAKRLRWFGGPLRRFEAVVDLSELDGLRLDLGGKTCPKIGAPVTELTLARSRAIRGLDFVSDPELVKKLVVEGAQDLDLQGIRAMVSLKSLEFERCANLRGAAAIADLVKLEILRLEDCPSVDDVASLLAVQGRTVVVGHNPFDESFRSAAPPSWSFPPGRKYLPHR